MNIDADFIASKFEKLDIKADQDKINKFADDLAGPISKIKGDVKKEALTWIDDVLKKNGFDNLEGETSKKVEKAIQTLNYKINESNKKLNDIKDQKNMEKTSIDDENLSKIKALNGRIKELEENAKQKEEKAVKATKKAILLGYLPNGGDNLTTKLLQEAILNDALNNSELDDNDNLVFKHKNGEIMRDKERDFNPISPEAWLKSNDYFKELINISEKKNPAGVGTGENGQNKPKFNASSKEELIEQMTESGLDPLNNDDDYKIYVQASEQIEKNA